MQIILTYTITDAIRNYIEEKVGKLERYFNNVPNAAAHLELKLILILQLKLKLQFL